MPDVHPGKVGTIGFTSTLEAAFCRMWQVLTSDAGYWLEGWKQKKTEFQKLDTVIRNYIPAGFQVRKREHRFMEEIWLSDLRCCQHINPEKAGLSLGTLGGGNHFIEVDRDEEGFLYVVIHSGSRCLGKEVTEYYLKKARNI